MEIKKFRYKKKHKTMILNVKKTKQLEYENLLFIEKSNK